jgi:Raf kinase inhibitor-like YbhB/YbcL family protein
MKYPVILVVIIILTSVLSACVQKLSMKITSPVFQNNDYLPDRFTCNGQNINPPIFISETPLNTKSLVLIVDDPDAPTGTWTHWLVWNIRSDTQEILENSVPKDAFEGITSWGKPGYNGPCPPTSVHRYFFRIFALDTVLDLRPLATVDQLLMAIQNHIVAKAEIIAKYPKK